MPPIPHRQNQSNRISISDLERIDESPEFNGTVSDLSLEEMAKAKPDIAFLVKQLSIEKEARKWLVDHMVIIHNAIVKNQETLQQLVVQVEEMAQKQREDRLELAEYREVTTANDKQIGEWKTNFTTPARYLAGLVIMLATAICGAIVGKFIK